MSDFKEKGVYSGTVLRHEMDVTAAGKPYISILFRAHKKENISFGWDEAEPFTRETRIYLSPAAIKNATETLQWFGYDEETLDRLKPSHPSPFVFSGKDIFVSCRYEEYNGNEKEVWNIVRRRKRADNKRIESALDDVSDAFSQAVSDLKTA